MNLEARRSLVLARPCCEFRKYDGYSVHTFPIPAESRNEIRIIDPPNEPYGGPPGGPEVRRMGFRHVEDKAIWIFERPVETQANRITGFPSYRKLAHSGR
jgi:hypothetical protein